MAKGAQGSGGRAFVRISNPFLSLAFVGVALFPLVFLLLPSENPRRGAARVAGHPEFLDKPPHIKGLRDDWSSSPSCVLMPFELSICYTP